MRIAFVVGALVSAGCSAGSTEPEPHPSIAGYFVAAEQPDIGLYLYDAVPGSQPEQFFVRQESPGWSYYWWGTYVQVGTEGLRFTLVQQEERGAPNVSGATWTVRPTALRGTVDGFGTLSFTRTADKAPGEK